MLTNNIIGTALSLIVTDRSNDRGRHEYGLEMCYLTHFCLQMHVNNFFVLYMLQHLASIIANIKLRKNTKLWHT